MSKAKETKPENQLEEASPTSQSNVHLIVRHSSAKDIYVPNSKAAFLFRRGLPVSFMVCFYPDYLLYEFSKAKGQPMPGKTARTALDELKTNSIASFMLLQITYDLGFMVSRRLLRARSRLLSLTYTSGVGTYLLGKSIFTYSLALPNGHLLNKVYQKNLKELAKFNISEQGAEDLRSDKAAISQKA